MFRRGICIVAGVVAGATCVVASVSEGQAVNYAPRRGVHVRAPFVSVDVSPYGGVSVRAPFTAVDVGGRVRYADPWPVVGDGPAGRFDSASLASLDDASLRQALLTAAERLHERLSRFDTGDTWQRYLRLPDEALAVAATSESSGYESIKELQQRFQSIAADPRYRMISELPAFTAMRAVLSEVTLRRARGVDPTGAHGEELPAPTRSRALGEGNLP